MIHVYPSIEEELHDLGEETTCPCGCEVETEVPEMIVVHRRFAPIDGETDLVWPVPGVDQ